MLPTFLTNEVLRLIFFGGKGGVGKTTTAAASAILLAEKHPNKKFLLISTDPAHSLGDSFEIEKQEARNKKQDKTFHASCFMPHASPGKDVEGYIADEAHALSVLPNLFLREFDAGRALETFKRKYGREIKLIADRGTYFDNEDINRFFDLSFPGIDEVMGILEIAELIDEYDTVMIDTAPTGHTLSMLKLPAILKKWMGVFSLMGEKHHILEEHFARQRSHDEADSFIETINMKLTRVNNLLCNTAETEFVVVANPEEMVMDETERLLHALFALKIPVRTLVINRVAEGGRCPYCERRSIGQRPFIERLGQKSSYKSVLIPLFPSEIKGVAKLKMFASAIMGLGGTIAERQEAGSKKQEARNRKHEAGKIYHASCILLPASTFIMPHASSRLSLSNLNDAKFIMIGGKGGVGKTTTSAATALLLAEKFTDRTYNLYSIDPAHSLGDCFGQSIGDKGLQVLPNLHVFELDADMLYLKFQEEYRSAIDNLFDQFVGGASYERGMDFGHDRELLNALFEMSPPGLNELMALHEVISQIAVRPEQGRRTNGDLSSPSGRFMVRQAHHERMEGADCIIFDTAPTGHFVRFLELPVLVRGWLTAIFELLLKYKGVVRLGEVAEKLVGLSKNIRSVMDILTDNKKTAAIVVTIPKAMAVAEAERLLESLNRYKIGCDGIVINMAAQASDCPLCAAYAADEAVWIEEAKKLCKSAAVVPYLAEDMCGVENLRRFGGLVWK